MKATERGAGRARVIVVEDCCRCPYLHFPHGSRRRCYHCGHPSGMMFLGYTLVELKGQVDPGCPLPTLGSVIGKPKFDYESPKTPIMGREVWP